MTATEYWFQTQKAAHDCRDKDNKSINQFDWYDVIDFAEAYHWEKMQNKWISVEDRPLFTYDDDGNWLCTEDGEKEFIALVPFTDINNPDEILWWRRLCIIRNYVGLCVLGVDTCEPSGWDLYSVTHWMPLPEPPKK